jgi:hypothetical protein
MLEAKQSDVMHYGNKHKIPVLVGGVFGSALWRLQGKATSFL